jgi:hypothetical protein
VGILCEKEIWKISKFEIIPYHKNESNINEEEQKFNSIYVSMLENILNAQSFYFSYNFDITHSLQRIHLQEANQDFLNASIFERADQRFVWNRFLLKNLSSTRNLGPYLVPIMLGYLSINTVEANGKKFDFTLISRRSCFNAGTRFNVRGSDDDGNVGNFVETEQIISSLDIYASYIQTRGSIPFFWSQKPNLKYKPSIKINDTKNQLEVFKKHFSKTIPLYNQHVCVNLVSQHGSEGMLESYFDMLVRQMNDSLVRYESFDFHKQCGTDRWDRLQILINRLANDQDTFESFCITKGGTLLNSQKGVFRINCIDCLDRTNVVQALMAKRILHIQLIKIGVLGENESIESHEALHSKFRNVWADNGDALSVQYAGTGALKSDFTRTGKRTHYGLLRDGGNSLRRYVINNFYDGFNQDSIDLLVGNYQIAKNEGIMIETTPVLLEPNKRFLALPIFGLGTFSMFTISFLIPAETFQEQLAYVIFWGLATVCTLGIMVYYGKEIVNCPKLVSRKNKNE